ncbi:hypothetical protein RND71_003430 [Anisodus tanguticus]|uniref:Uncharacterized protein n=1 Tax=Anisodus tanguticus TaxID=243964 RepID=A0AAE1SWF4_9SOLA|nr:hypothetical protein RND71_003430 [Anisodus tanguticus]
MLDSYTWKLDFEGYEYRRLLQTSFQIDALSPTHKDLHILNVIICDMTLVHNLFIHNFRFSQVSNATRYQRSLTLARLFSVISPSRCIFLK